MTRNPAASAARATAGIAGAPPTRKTGKKTEGQSAAKGGASRSPAAEEEAAPSLSTADALALRDELRAFIAENRNARAMELLRKLASDPPQTLLLEGGTARERSFAALYWATLLNCPGPSSGVKHAPPPSRPGQAPASEDSPPKTPCLACPECLRFLSRSHRDLFWFDGAAGSIKIAPVRELKSVLGTAPREAARRIVIVAEAQALTEDAANALLKSLEEPRPGTAFALLTPQRERLLPTLVSRSWVLTLAWPDPGGPGQEEEQEWSRRFAEFMAHGTGLFDRSGARGAMDAAAAATALTALQRGLAAAMAGPIPTTGDPLARAFAALPPERLRMADEVIAEAKECLDTMVTPGLILEWAATRFFLLLPRR